MPARRPALVPLVTTRCGFLVFWAWRCASARSRAAQLAGSSGTGWGRRPSRMVCSDGVDVQDLEQPHLDVGHGVQQREDTQQRLVRVDGGVGGPPAEQGTLTVHVRVVPVNPRLPPAGHPPGGIDQYDPPMAGEPKEASAAS